MTASDTRSSDRVSSFALAMRAVPSSAIFGMDGHHVWDPSVIEVDGTFHLFASRWPVEAGFEGWRGSEVIRAVAPSLLGPYTFCEVVLRAADHPFARRGVHNPKTVRIGERFLLYHLAIPPWQTGFALATSINGPWTVVDHPVIPTSNPAILARPDGSIYAVGKCKPEPVRPSGCSSWWTGGR